MIPTSKTVEYFCNIVDQNKAKKLYSIYITRCI